MTAEDGVHKVEIEDKCGLDTSSNHDLPEVGGGDCNGVSGVIDNGKDDSDASYVFVSGNDAAADDGDRNAETVLEPEEETEVRIGGSNVKSGGMDNCIVEPNCNCVGDIALEEGSQDGNEAETSVSVEEHNGTAVVESETQVVDDEVKAEEPNGSVAVESESRQLDGEVAHGEPINLQPLNEIQESQEPQIVILKAARCETPQLDDAVGKDGEEISVDSIPQIDQSHESQMQTTKTAESEINNGAGDADGENKSDSAMDVKGNQESENMVHLDLDEEKETAEAVHEISAEGGPGIDATSPVSDLHLETDVGNGSVPDVNGDGLPICHDQDVCREIEVIDASVHDSQNRPQVDVSSEKAESFPLSVDGIRSELEVGNVPGERLPGDPDNDSVTEPDAGTNVPSRTDSFPSFAIDDVQPETEIQTSDARISESSMSCPGDDTVAEIKVENGHIEAEGPVNDVQSAAETEIGFGSISCEAKDSALPCENMNIESEVSNVVPEHACVQQNLVVHLDTGSHVGDSAENETSLPTCAVSDVKSESVVENASATGSRDMYKDDATVSDFEVSSGSVVDCSNVPNSVSDVIGIENEGDQFATGESDHKKICQENEDIEGIPKDETATSSPEDTSGDALVGQNADTEAEKRPFYFLIRIPRYDDQNLKDQIKNAQLRVEEKTQIRDAIRAEIHAKKATRNEYNDAFEAAISEERAARDSLKSKRQEVDSVQSVINRVKNAISVEDIDGRIRNMEHMIEHETLPLKEEKHFIREIKQLKQLREQLSTSMGRQEDVQQALDQRDQLEDRLKSLKKEVDLLRDNVLKAEVVTKSAKKKYFEESEQLNELRAKFEAADVVRQAAYAELQSLRKQLSEKNKYFRKYKDDEKAANEYAFSSNKEALQKLCFNQVETIMGLWNTDDEFRKEYIKCNIRSTLRRLQTSDGRSLGPDEEPPLLPNVANGRAGSSLSAPSEGKHLVSPASSLELPKQVVPVETEKVDDTSTTMVVDLKSQMAKIKGPTKPAPVVDGSATVSGRVETKEAREEEHKLTMEEEESARKAEELRKEELEAKLKEQREEERNKSEEALKRKQRMADKARARAELRAQKEAEQKEKEREKKARKKERKKAASVEVANASNEGDSALSSEGPTETMEPEISEKPMTTTLRSQKPSRFTKQNKSKSIPPPLRNRGRRRMQSWMWVCLTMLIFIVLFMAGNGGFSVYIGLKSLGF